MPWTWIRPDVELRAAAKQPEYQSILDRLRRRVHYWMDNFTDSTELIPGWGHNYVCPKCASHLLFDSARPGIYHCPACGEDMPPTDELDEAWTYYRRFEISQTVYEAGILYRIEQRDEYADFIRNVVTFYADNYHNFHESGTHAGRGKIQGQSLDESVWGVNVLKGLILLGIDSQSDQAQYWYGRLFLPMARLVMAQQWGIHNIPLWHSAFAVGAGLIFDDEALIRLCYAGSELGARNQVLKGFTEDGIWYENSTGYHYYSLDAATNLCFFIRWAGRENEATDVFQRILDAYLAFLKLGFRDGTMPPFNDGWRQNGLEGLVGKLDTYLGAARLFDGVEGIKGARRVADAISTLNETGRLGGLLYGKVASVGMPEPYGTVHLPSNYLAVLRSDRLEVFAKYGNITRSHAHPDALSIAIPGFSEDLGTCGYGSPFYRNWYTQTLSHNTFIVDGQSQNYVAKGTAVLTCEDTLVMRVSDAYKGVIADRTLHIKADTLEDSLTVDCDAAHTIDWIFHGNGAFKVNGATVSDTIPETDNGYSCLTSVKRYVDDTSRFTAQWTLNKRTLSLMLDAVTDDAAIYLAQSPDNPADHQRHAVLVRTRGLRFYLKARFILA